VKRLSIDLCDTLRSLLVILFFVAGLASVPFSPVDAADLDGIEVEPITREHQAELFDRMREQPDDLALMMAYARLSVALKDYEAAISTLERMLLYVPDLTTVKVELGAAYYRLGSDQVADYYFQQALASPDISEAARAQIARYQAQIGKNLAESSFSGMVMAGLNFSTNANLGLADNLIRSPGVQVNLPSGAQAENDVGLRVVLDLQHEYDLGQADGDVWRTNGFFYALQFLEQDSGNVNDLLIRTGPTISLSDEAFGPVLRPFVEVEFLRSNDHHTFSAFGGGFEFTKALDEEWSFIGTAKAQYRDFGNGRNDYDGAYGRGQFGLAYIPNSKLVLRGLITGDFADAQRQFNDFFQVGLMAAASYTYDPGVTWVDRNWRAEGYVEVARSFFGAPDPTVDPTSRRIETDFRAGIGNTFFLVDNFFGRIDVDFVDRNSSIPNFSVDNLSTTISFGSTL